MSASAALEWFPCQNANRQNARRQAGQVERLLHTTRARQRKATDQAGHHSGCWSEARTPREAAIKSPANGARWRKGKKAVGSTRDI